MLKFLVSSQMKINLRKVHFPEVHFGLAIRILVNNNGHTYISYISV